MRRRKDASPRVTLKCSTHAPRKLRIFLDAAAQVLKSCRVGAELPRSRFHEATDFLRAARSCAFVPACNRSWIMWWIKTCVHIKKSVTKRPLCLRSNVHNSVREIIWERVYTYTRSLLQKCVLVCAYKRRLHRLFETARKCFICGLIVRTGKSVRACGRSNARLRSSVLGGYL
jgi:hypothetical protein